MFATTFARRPSRWRPRRRRRMIRRRPRTPLARPREKSASWTRMRAAVSLGVGGSGLETALELVREAAVLLHGVDLRAAARSSTVRIPVPGPISSTRSPGRIRGDGSRMMAWSMKCCPSHRRGRWRARARGAQAALGVRAAARASRCRRGRRGCPRDGPARELLVLLVRRQAHGLRAPRDVRGRRGARRRRGARGDGPRRRRGTRAVARRATRGGGRGAEATEDVIEGTNATPRRRRG